VPIISNQVNVQVGALANVVIMLCITLWALYLIFHNKAVITQVHLADRSLSFFSLFIRAFALIWHWLACAYFIVLFFFSCSTRQQPEIYDGRHAAQPGDYRRRGAGLRHAVALDSENHHPVAATQRNYPELQSG
jgi:hypothetical protein